jgi:hypothetical protein
MKRETKSIMKNINDIAKKLEELTIFLDIGLWFLSATF